MSVLGKTFDKWFQYRIIRISLAITIVLGIIILSVSISYPVLNTFLQFLGEIIGVSIALIFGFYWNRAHERIIFEDKLTKILDLFIVELRDNKTNLLQIYSSGRGDYIPYSLKSTVWEVYKEQLGEAEVELVDDLSNIYYKILLLNESIKQYRGDPSLSSSILDRLITIRDKTIKEIESWLSEIDTLFP